MTFWNECLAQGDRFVHHWLNECCDLSGWTVEHAPRGQFKDWDVRLTHVDGNKCDVEVKSDTRAAQTGNIAIEFACSGRPSGIAATKADWWVHFISETEYFIIPVKTLRWLIKKNKWWRMTNGGDGGRAEMYLFDKSIFTRWWKSVEPHSLEAP